MDIEEFKKRAIAVYGDKYDYSKSVYVTHKTKIEILCPEHGAFYQNISNFLRGYGCHKCGKRPKWDTSDFIQKAKEVHGDKYDYSKVEYKGASSKVCIICPEHGEFWQQANCHLMGRGCTKCATNAPIPHEEAYKKVLDKCKEKGYILISDFNYTNINSKFRVKCLKDGYEWNTYFANFITKNRGCTKCAIEYNHNISRTPYEIALDDVLKICSKKNLEIVGDFVYKNSNSRINLRCLNDGYEWSPVYKDIVGKRGHGCPKCSGKIVDKTYIDDFINNMCKKYNYILEEPFEYNNCFSKIKLRCCKHNIVWTPTWKDFSKEKCLCPKCKNFKLEIIIDNFLNINDIKHEKQKRLTGTRQFLDFFITNMNIGIECHGEQHFIPNLVRFGEDKGNKNFEYVRDCDLRKHKYCKENGITLLYYSECEKSLTDTYFDYVYTDKDELLAKIKEVGKINNI